MTLTTQSTRAFRVALLCLLLGLAPAQAAMAQSAALIRLVPGSATVGVGSTTAVEVRIENVADLYGCDIRITFNPAAVEVVDADNTAEGLQTRPGNLLTPDFVVRNQADNASGTVWFALTQLNPSEAVTGSGVVFIVTFRGKVAGASSPLAFSYQKLASRTGDLIPASAEDGEIRVVSAEQAPPTPTTAPTLAPPTAVPPTAPPPTSAPTSAPTSTPVPQPTAAATTTKAPPAAAETAVEPTASVPTASPPATSAPATAVAPTAVSVASLPPPTATTVPVVPVPGATATRVPASPTATPVPGPLARSSIWLVVYGFLFAAAFAVAVIGMKARRNKQQ